MLALQRGQKRFSRAVPFDDVIDVLVAAPREVHEDTARFVRAAVTDGVGECMGTFDGGDDPFEPTQQEERFHGFVVGNGLIANTADVVQMGMLRPDGGVIQTACNGVDGGSLAVFLLQEIAFKAVQNALRTVADACGMVAMTFSTAERFNANELNGVLEERNEHSDGVRTAADTSCYHVGQNARRLQELLPRFNADDGLEITHHLRERMRANGASDAVDGGFIFLAVRSKGGIDRFLQRLSTVRDGDDSCTEQLHTRYVRGLLLNVNFSHVDVAFQTKVGGGGRNGNSVLSGTRLGDQLLFAEVRGQQTFSHAMIELVCARVIEVLSFQVDLTVAKVVRQPFTMVNGRRPALKFLADAAKLMNEFCTVTDRLVGVGDVVEHRFQLGRQKTSAVAAEAAVLIGKLL